MTGTVPINQQWKNSVVDLKEQKAIKTMGLARNPFGKVHKNTAAKDNMATPPVIEGRS